MKTTLSIGRYIGTQVAILITALIIIYSLMISQVYQWGLHDSTHYFLSQEADKVWDALNSTGQLPPEPSPHTHYFLDKSQLPDAFDTIFPVEKRMEGALLSHEIKGDIVYLLAYLGPNTNQLFYVSHTYRASEDNYAVEINIPALILLLAIVSLAILIFLVNKIAWSIINPVRSRICRQ